MPSKFTCPRRAESRLLTAEDENQDSYERGRGLVGQQKGCTYCGSMSPEDFMTAVRDKAVIGPTDKSYKLYVGDHQGKFYTPHLNEEQGEEFYQLMKDLKINWGYPGHNYVPIFLPGPSTKQTQGE